MDPDTPDEATAVESLEEAVDEGFKDYVKDPTVFEPDMVAAGGSGDPADPPRLRVRQPKGRFKAAKGKKSQW